VQHKVWAARGRVECSVDRLVLFELDDVGMRGHFGEAPVIEFSDDLVLDAVAPLEVAGFESLFQDGFRQSKFFEQIES
jgi:hypothetical protein